MQNRLYNAGIIPVVKLDDPDLAVPLAEALLEGGVDVIEVTFRTAAAAAAIESIAAHCPDMLVGAGTVVTRENLESAYNAGASFIVSPGLNPATVTAAQEKGLFVLPGIVTPSELEQGLSLGLDTFKFFPAAAFGGVRTIEALRAPYSGVRFVPTGGVNADNVVEYLKSKAVLAVGGTWIASGELVAQKQFSKITALTAEAKRLCRQARG